MYFCIYLIYIYIIILFNKIYINKKEENYYISTISTINEKRYVKIDHKNLRK